MIAFCVLVKVFMVLVEMNTAWVIKISQIHKTFVGPKQVHIKWTMLHFVVVTSTYFFSDHHLHRIIRNKQHFIDKDFSNSLPIYSLSVSFQYLFLRPTWLRISGNKTKSFRQLYSGFGQHDFGLVVFCVTWLEPWWTPPRPDSNIPLGRETWVLQCWQQAPALRQIYPKILFI